MPFESCSFGLANNVLKYGTWDSFLTFVKLVVTWSEERRVLGPPEIGLGFPDVDTFEDDITIDSEGDLVLATQGLVLGWVWSELRLVRAANGFSLYDDSFPWNFNIHFSIFKTVI